MTSWRLVTLMAVVLAVLSTVAPGRCDDGQLQVVQDESAMERVIEAYLKANYNVEVTEKTLEAGDLALVVKMEGQGGPDFNVVVDTQSSGKNEAGTVLERVVAVQVYTGVKVPAAKRAAMLEAMNELQAANWFASIYLDEDAEISCQWCVNVMKQGLPTAYVADAIIRVADTWRKFRLRAQDVLAGQ